MSTKPFSSVTQHSVCVKYTVAWPARNTIQCSSEMPGSNGQGQVTDVTQWLRYWEVYNPSITKLSVRGPCAWHFNPHLLSCMNKINKISHTGIRQMQWMYNVTWLVLLLVRLFTFLVLNTPNWGIWKKLEMCKATFLKQNDWASLQMTFRWQLRMER